MQSLDSSFPTRRWSRRPVVVVDGAAECAPECSICWEPLDPDGCCWHPPHHRFHETCLQRWWTERGVADVPHPPCPCCGADSAYALYCPTVRSREELVALLELTPDALAECFDHTLHTHEELDVSRVHNFDNLFETCPHFNAPLGRWDTRNVRSMCNTFAHSAFNQPLNTWNVSRVRTMQAMFHGAVAFNQPLDDWDVSQVQTMCSMFESTPRFNQPLGSWHLASLRDANSMFLAASVFNQPLDAWNVSSVTDMAGMFQEASRFNQPLLSWDVSNVTTMERMFYHALHFNQPLFTWQVQRVRSVAYLFAHSAFRHSLQTWDLASVEEMECMLSDDDADDPHEHKRARSEITTPIVAPTV